MQDHGTRSRYVSGCRCPACRESNRLYYHARNQRSKELAKLLPTQTTTIPGRKVIWGKEVQVTYKRACPGIEGKPCVKKTYLKKNSTGTLCGYCREHLLSTHQLVDAKETRKALRALSAKGVGTRTVADIAEISRTTLQLIRRGVRKKVDPDTQAAVLDFLNSEKLCSTCGRTHDTPNARRELLRTLLPASLTTLQQHSCMYPPNKNGECRAIFRDLHAIQARTDGAGHWALP